VAERGRVKVTAVATRTLTDEIAGTRPQAARPFHVIVHNCNCHSFDDVIFGLMRIVGMGMRDAELKAKEIDFFGRGVVATVDHEAAELYANRLHNEVVSVWGTLLQTSVEPA
jgi:ATP-dependent Clp protease adapter protein ClpS